MADIDRNKHVTCYNCNTELEFTMGETIIRHEECPSCQVSLKCCRMCNYYDRSVYNECRESLAERIVEKEKANFCGYFVLAGDCNNNKDKQELEDAASALFK